MNEIYRAQLRSKKENEVIFVALEMLNRVLAAETAAQEKEDAAMQSASVQMEDARRQAQENTEKQLYSARERAKEIVSAARRAENTDAVAAVSREQIEKITSGKMLDAVEIVRDILLKP